MEQLSPHGGWHLLALADEITSDVTGLMLGGRALAMLRDGGSVRVVDGRCPHRGAHLGHGGRLLDGRAIICPFHGKRVRLGTGPERLRVREHHVLDCGDAIFVRLSAPDDAGQDDRGFERTIKELTATHMFAGAISGHVGVPPRTVIENAFDIDHFGAVHLVPRVTGMTTVLEPGGELSFTTEFHTKAPAWAGGGERIVTRFHARAFSPSLVLTELDAPGKTGAPGTPNVVITGATPAPGGGSVVRIAVAVPHDAPAATGDMLIAGARHAFEQDVRIWNHLDTTAPERLDSRDAPIRSFRAFCACFAALPE